MRSRVYPEPPTPIFNLPPRFALKGIAHCSNRSKATVGIIGKGGNWGRLGQVRQGSGCGGFRAVDKAFQDFHAYFAPLFGRRETRDHGRHCLQALLVQSGERRNAEKLSEPVPASARVMRRFLAESPWDDVIGRRQEYLGPRSGPMEACW